MSESQFAAINQYLSTSHQLSAPHWQAFAGGSSNALFRGQVEDCTLVLRLNAPGSLAFGVDRQREAAVLSLIGTQEWAPEVLCNEPEAGWLLMKWHGDRLTGALSIAEQEQLLAAVTQWQQISSADPKLQVDYRALYDAFRPEVKGLPMEQPLLALIEGAHSAMASLPELASVLTHHDLHPGNLCVQDNQLVVVDWEYGAIGNPWFDLAAMHLHCNVPSEQLNRLPAVSTIEPQYFEQGLRRSVWLLEVLETLWYWVRGLSGTDITMKALVTQTIALLKQ